MRVSSVGFVPVFKGTTSANIQENQQQKKPVNLVSTTGYLTLGLFGAAMVTGIEKKLKLHRAACYLAMASAIGHIASLSTHKHQQKPQNV